jgi:6-phosphogluconate dehydrogenase
MTIKEILFTSFYNFKSNPVIKGGLNYYISYKTESLPITLVQKIQCRRAFLEILKDEKTTKQNPGFTMRIATGYQFIEDDSKQWT